MPRKNKRPQTPHFHELSTHEQKGNPSCRGCAFAGVGCVCTTSDGKCLKGRVDIKSNTKTQAGRSLLRTARPSIPGVRYCQPKLGQKSLLLKNDY